MNTSDILNKAADLIEQRGWGTGISSWVESSNPEAPLCIEGGIEAAMGLTEADVFGSGYFEFQACPAYRAVRAYLELESPYLYDFNDKHGRTASEVVEVLRACAVIESSRERETAAVS